MASRRKAVLEITAENKVSGPLQRASGDLRAFGQDAAKMGRDLVQLGKLGGVAIAGIGAVGGVAAKQLYDLVRASGDAVDGMGEAAQKLGIATSDLQKYQIAAKFAGAESGSLEKALGFLNRSIGKIRSGLEGMDGKTAGVLKSLGLSEEDILAADPGQVFEKVVAGLSKIQDPAERSAKAIQLLGRGAADLNILFQQGAPALERAAKLIKDYGIGIDDLDAQKVGEMNDKFDELALVLDFAKKKLAVELAPVITEVTGDLLELAKEGRGLGPAIAEGAKLGINALRALGGAIRAVTGGTSEMSLGVLGLDDDATKGRAILDRISQIQKLQDQVKSFGEVNGLANDEQMKIYESAKEFMTIGEKLWPAFDDEGMVKRLEEEVGALTDGFKNLPPEVQATAKAYKELAENEKLLNEGSISSEQAKSREEAIRNELKLVEQRWEVERQLAAEAERRNAAAAQATAKEEEALKLSKEKAETEKQTVEHIKSQEEALGPLGQLANELREEDAWDGMVLPPLEQVGAGAEEALLPVTGLANAIGDGPKSVVGQLERASSASTAFKDQAVTDAQDVEKAFVISFESLNMYGEAVTSNIERAIDDFTRDGKIDMKEFARSVLADLAAIAAKAAILGGIFGSSQYGGSSGGLLGTLVYSLAGGMSTYGAPQAIPVGGSYDGGGFTGIGARSGGVDGKGGFPAILHPNETVIDHTKGGGSMGGNTYITQNIVVRETLPSGQARAIVDLAKAEMRTENLSTVQRGGARSKSFRGVR